MENPGSVFSVWLPRTKPLVKIFAHISKPPYLNFYSLHLSYTYSLIQLPSMELSREYLLNLNTAKKHMLKMITTTYQRHSQPSPGLASA